MDAPTYRPELPDDMPASIAALHVSRGYPVPWFVVWLKDGQPVPAGEGEPDFRVLKPGAFQTAWHYDRCWICGGPLGVTRAFVLGPMCAVNRTSSEPPSHESCADWAARACPFLTRPHMARRDNDLPDGIEQPAGLAIPRNPGVALVWITRPGAYSLRKAPNGVLVYVGDPVRVAWYAEGRAATRAEVETSIDSGLPQLREMAEAQGKAAVKFLGKATYRARRLLPAP